MADNVNIANPVRVESDATARVALDLMHHIANWEEVPQGTKDSRDYWLTLYRQAYKAASGVRLEHVLTKM